MFASQCFEVHWRDHGSQTFTASYISVDGFLTSGRFLDGTGSTSRSGARSGPDTERKYQFAELQHFRESHLPMYLHLLMWVMCRYEGGREEGWEGSFKQRHGYDRATRHASSAGRGKEKQRAANSSWTGISGVSRGHWWSLCDVRRLSYLTKSMLEWSCRFSKEQKPCNEQSPSTWATKPLDPNFRHSFVKFIWMYRPMSS